MTDNFKPTWVIQTNCLDQNQTQSVALAVNATGGIVVEAKVEEFVKYSQDPYTLGQYVVPYGGIRLLDLVGEKHWLGTFYGCFFDTVIWNQNRTDMLNQDSQVMTVNEAIKYLEQFSPDLPMFVRPCSVVKSFAGAQVDAQEILSWMKAKRSGKYTFSGELLVSIAPAKVIISEQRWFIVDGKVIDGSIYRMRNQVWLSHITDEETKTEMQALADKWLPHRCCVMDVALTDEGYKVIEFNRLNTSGFYAHDIHKVVSAVNAYMHKLHKLS